MNTDQKIREALESILKYPQIKDYIGTVLFNKAEQALTAETEQNELKPCPFCGEQPDLPSGNGTQYEIECGGCGQATASVQISDLMTIEERVAAQFTSLPYEEKYIDRAKAEATKRWNTRQALAAEPEQPAQLVRLTDDEIYSVYLDDKSELEISIYDKQLLIDFVNLIQNAWIKKNGGV